jgi:CRP-like cAMP-binding protein
LRLSLSAQETLEKSIRNYKIDRYSILIEKVIYLNQVEVLNGLDQRLLEDLSMVMRHEKAPVGTELVRKGAEDNNYYFIIKGSATFSGDPGLLFESNQIVNDMLFMDADNNNAVVKVTEAVEFFKINHQDFKNLLFKYPELGDIMLHVFDLRLSDNVKVS